ncbi:HlyD family secretion protein [Ancylobacter oerskovii]|uniref:HlyD family secretion protein n=1 Tax=Ancylobacter oerskovii TaxID=459519 RepID=A0ABW4Z4R0_9HYPH
MKLGGAMRVVMTLAAVAMAVVIAWQLWIYYTLSPWTRDARVLANVVQVAPDVSGLISAVHVKDNQKVAKGDLLFEIDRERFEAALDHARGDLEIKKAARTLAWENALRYRTLRQEESPGLSIEAVERMTTLATEADGALVVAQANLAIAEINMRRSRIYAPVNGHVTNLTTLPGDFASAGKGVLALVDSDSFYVYGYFMETKLPRIAEGAKAKVELMAGGVVLDGMVEGLARAIANPDDVEGLLASVPPQFSWIRLAQRIPVRIRLRDVPPTVLLASGMSATIVIMPGPAPH